MESYDPPSSFQRRSFRWSSSLNNDEYDYKKRENLGVGRRLFSRSRHQIPKSNIQKWIENVEKSVFDDGTLGQVLTPGMHLPSQQKFSRMSLAQMTLDQLRHHDEAQQEAEDLLNDWVQKKLYEPNILNDDLDEFLNQANGAKSQRRSPDLSLSSDFDEDAAVDAVLQKMLRKNVVPVKVRKDLGFDSSKKQVDPRVKMELRRKQVRENRMKKEKELEKRRQEMQLKKEARLKAHQKVMEEEKLKEVKRRQEEYEIQKEMTLIRKQMKEEKKLAEEKRKKDLELAEKTSVLSEPEICQKEWEKAQERVEACRHKEECQRQQAAKMEMLKIRQKTLELQSLHRHFSAWYTLVLQQRLRVGKACALADWKLLLRSWNTWRSVTNRHQIDKELQQHQQDIKDKQRKDKKASLHYSGRLLQKYFLTWQLYLHGEKERRLLEESQLATKKRMKALLDAALSRKLPPPGNTAEKVLDNQEVLNENQQSPDTVRSENNGKLDSATSQGATKVHLAVNGMKENSMPNEHWKIRKSLVHMKPSKMAAMLGAEYRKSSAGPNASPLEMNTIGRQLQSQKKLVKEQQKQLQEQRRMIEQLQIDQRRQELKEQLKKQQQTDRPPVKERINRSSESTERSRSSHRQSVTVRRNSISEPNSLEPNSTSSSPRRGKMKNCDQQKTFVLRRSQSMDFISAKDQKILKNMEARASERIRMKEERKARKQQKEEEKLALLRAAEEEHLKQEEEERKARLKARQEQKRLEQQKEVERQKRLVEMQQLNAKADDFRKYLLLKYKGILQWKKLIVITRNNHTQAVQHSSSTLLVKCMTAWSVHVQETNNFRNQLADTKFKQIIVVRLFRRWKNYNNYASILEEKADRFYLSNLRFKIFKSWLSYSSEQTMALWEKEEMAQKHYKRQLQRRMFDIWRTFPEMKKKQMERQERREKLRQKVSMLIPDFGSEQ